MRNWIFILPLFLCLPIGAVEEDLEEAQGLAPSPVHTVEKASAPSQLKYQGYLFTEGALRQYHLHPQSDASFPYVEGSFTGAYNLTPQIQPFLDFLATFNQATGKFGFMLNAVGVRYRPTESIVVAIGKERNRRSPGLIISPSDFIHSNQALPGIRQDRAGVWLARIAYQKEKDTLELFYLPFLRSDSSGFPNSNPSSTNFLARYFKQVGVFDLALSGGNLDESWKVSGSAQALVASWKLYVEASYEENRLGFPRSHLVSGLLGMGFEKSDKIIPRAEIYMNGADLSDGELIRLAGTGSQNPFPRKYYSLLSVSFIDFVNDWNFTPTVIKSLEDSGIMAVGRLEWAFHSNHTFGSTFIWVGSSTTNQYRYAPIDWQWTLDWRISY